MGDDCSVWFNTVLRGDVNSIRIGNRVNIQDGSVLHTLYEKSVIEIGDNVSSRASCDYSRGQSGRKCTAGHGLYHPRSCRGRQKIRLWLRARLFLTGTIIEPGSIYAGVPAKRVKSSRPGTDEVK